MRKYVINCCRNSEPSVEHRMQLVQAQQGAAVAHLVGPGEPIYGAFQPVLPLSCASFGQMHCVADSQAGKIDAIDVGVRQASGDVTEHRHGDDYCLHNDRLQVVVAQCERSSCGWPFARVVDSRAVP